MVLERMPRVLAPGNGLGLEAELVVGPAGATICRRRRRWSRLACAAEGGGRRLLAPLEM